MHDLLNDGEQAERTSGRPSFMDADVYNVTYSTLLLPYAVALFIFLWVRGRKHHRDFSHIPSVGSSNCCVGAVKFLFNAQGLLQEGYERHKLAAFKVFNLTRWAVVIASPQSLEEVRKASDNDLHPCEVPHMSHTLTGAGIAFDTGDMIGLSTKLTRSLPLLFVDMHNEVVSAFHDVLPSDSISGWTQVSAVDAITEVITRVSNRMVVGLPLCRNQDFLALNERLVKDGTKVAAIIGMFPETLLKIVVYIFTSICRDIKEMQKIIEATVDGAEREEKYSGAFSSHSHDLLSKLIREDQDTTSEIARRVLAMSLEAVQTPCMTFTHALYHLALAKVDVVQSMRDEIDAELRREGWALAALDRMRKVDSFLKESMRVSGFRALTMMRKSVGGYTFADGTHVPADTLLCAPSASIHLDDAKYPHAATFDAFRFARLSESSISSNGGSGSRYMLSTTTPDFLAWGHGRTACPGRFLAATQMKLMLAYFVLHYDVRFPEGDDAVRPEDWWLGASRFPDLGARVMVRRRR